MLLVDKIIVSFSQVGSAKTIVIRILGEVEEIAAGDLYLFTPFVAIVQSDRMGGRDALLLPYEEVADIAATSAARSAAAAAAWSASATASRSSAAATALPAGRIDRS